MLGTHIALVFIMLCSHHTSLCMSEAMSAHRLIDLQVHEQSIHLLEKAKHSYCNVNSNIIIALIDKYILNQLNGTTNFYDHTYNN